MIKSIAMITIIITMGKNIKGGSKHKKYARVRDTTEKLNLKELKKEPEQEYAFVVNVLGNCRFELLCYDNKTRLGCLRGKMRKRVWVNKNDCILVGLRDFQDEKCDIIQKYTETQLQFLIKKKELKPDFAHNGIIQSGEIQSDENMSDDFDMDDV